MPTSHNILPSGFNTASIRCSVSDLDGESTLSIGADVVRVDGICVVNNTSFSGAAVTTDDVICKNVVFEDTSHISSTHCVFSGPNVYVVNTAYDTVGTTLLQFVLWNNTTTTQYPLFQIRPNSSTSWTSMLNDTGGLAAGVTRAYGACLVPAGWQWQVSTASSSVNIMRVSVIDLK